MFLNLSRIDRTTLTASVVAAPVSWQVLIRLFLNVEFGAANFLYHVQYSGESENWRNWKKNRGVTRVLFLIVVVFPHSTYEYHELEYMTSQIIGLGKKQSLLACVWFRGIWRPSFIIYFLFICLPFVWCKRFGNGSHTKKYPTDISMGIFMRL